MNNEDTSQAEMAAGYVRAETLAQILGLSVRSVQYYRANGALVTEKTQWGQRYNFRKSCIAFIKFLLQKLDTAGEKQRALTADANYKERKAELMLLELRKRRGELHEARHVEAIFMHNILTARAAFLALPGRISQELSTCAGANEINAVLRKAIIDILNELAAKKYDPEEFRKLVEEEDGFIADEEEENE